MPYLKWGNSMQIRRTVLQAALLIALLGSAGVAKDLAVRIAAIPCGEGCRERVPLRSTDRLPGASGTASLERKGGTTAIALELSSIKPATLFGGDYNTYVLWVVPPSGLVENHGEIAIDGSRGEIHATTSAVGFALLVTAEPHYMVRAPSAFVVLTNETTNQNETIEQPLIVGIYQFRRSTLDDVKAAKGKVHSRVKQAFTAVRLAQRAGAAVFAPEEFSKAKASLEATVRLWKDRKDRTEIDAEASETIRLAVSAQRLAEDHAVRS
jgi:hypothetical protein